MKKLQLDVKDIAGRELAWLFLVNCLFSALLFAGYVLGIPTGLQGMDLVALPAAMISQAAFINLGLLVIVAGPTLVWPQHRWGRWFATILFGFAQIGLLADVAIFRLFRRHFDGMIWNVLVTKGASDSVIAGRSTVLAAGAAFVGVFVLGVILARQVVPQLVRYRFGYPVIMLLACMLWERATFAVADFQGKPTLNCLRDTLPLYQPLTFKSLARKFGWKPDPSYRVPLPAKSAVVELPQQRLGLGSDAQRPNLVVVVIEGGRFDALTDRAMPHLWALSNDAFKLTKHFSTGNETCFGIMGLLYGIPGSYWHYILAQRKGPPWLSFLSAEGYEMKVLSCTDLNFPEFRQTAFVEFEPAITDRWKGPRVERDKQMTDVCVSFINERSARVPPLPPFFCFLFYDASHQPYLYSPEDAVFASSVQPGEINYAQLAISVSASQEIHSRYLNSLHYVDRQVKRVIEALKDTGEYEQTIIIVVGDHGEEFGESGQFGHTSSFNRYQIQTFGVLRLPGHSPQIVGRLTSHVDFLPSVLTFMGVTNALGDYTTGIPIQAGSERAGILTSGWQTTALVQEDTIAVFKNSQAYYYDMDYRVLASKDSRRPHSEDILRAIKETKHFFK